MDSTITQSVNRIFQQWQSEDRELEDRVDELRDWMQEVNQLGIPHFGETAGRLRPLRRLLVGHFDREDEMMAQLAKAYPASSPEVHGAQEHSTHDHLHLLCRVDELINRLAETEPPFDSWQAAMDDVEILVEALEQHEEDESDCVKMLLTITPKKRKSAK